MAPSPKPERYRLHVLEGSVSGPLSKISDMTVAAHGIDGGTVSLGSDLVDARPDGYRRGPGEGR